MKDIYGEGNYKDHYIAFRFLSRHIDKFFLYDMCYLS